MIELKSNLKVQFAESFLNSLEKEDNYLFLGNTFTDNDPAKDSILEENNAKKSLLCAYKIYPDDASFCISRINWENGTVYTAYDDSLELGKNTLNYYVVSEINSKYRVYKCIKNGNNSPSIVMPSGISIEEEYSPQDGYVWKFLYEIPESLEKFITDEYVPVPVLSQNFYEDERSLQKLVQNSTKPGSIKQIKFDFSSSYGKSLSFNDIINQDFLNNNCRILAKELNPQNGNTQITLTLSNIFNPTFLSPENNYYNNNYIIIFPTSSEGYVVADIKKYEISTGNSNNVILELDNIVGNQENIVLGSPYSIVPKIKISGDGSGAIAIPIFSNYELVDIQMIKTGSNYIKAKAYFLLETPYELRPIISPNTGHGSLAYEELYAKNIIISKTVSKHTNTVSQNNKYFFGNNNTVNQFGIITGIKSTDGTVLKKEKSLHEITLIKNNIQLLLKINYYNNNIGIPLIPELFFNVNDIITRGSSFKKNQFRAKVLNVEIGTNDETIVLLELQNGKFENFPNLNLKNKTTNRNFLVLNDEIELNYFNLPDEEDLEGATHIFGNQSLFTSIIKETNEFEEFTKISYVIEDLTTTPITSFFTFNGSLVLGEPVTLLKKNQDENFEIVQNNFMNVLEIIPKNSTIDTTYSYILKLKANARTIVYPADPITSDSYISKINIINKYVITKDLQNFGRVLFAQYFDDEQGLDFETEEAFIYIKPEKGNFLQFSNLEDKELFLLESDPYLSINENNLISLNAFCDENNSELEFNSSTLDINSGKIVYLNNIHPVSLNDNQIVKINIILEF